MPTFSHYLIVVLFWSGSSTELNGRWGLGLGVWVDGGGGEGMSKPTAMFMRLNI